MDMSTDLCGVRLKNPLIAASGTFGFGREYDELYDISCWGGISVKGLTNEPRAGNPPHRIAETASGMLNSVGLQNPGADEFIRSELPWLSRKGTVVIANVAGSAIEDYCEAVRKLSDAGVDMIELNISCPNVRQGGVQFGTRPESAAEVTGAVRRCCGRPLMVKLSPNVSDITAIAKAAEEAGADAISLINTLTGLAIDARTRRPILASVTGGLSGPAIKPAALRMVWQTANAVSVPVVGMGGIETGIDAAEFLIAGARAVMIGTANIRDPYAGPRILSELESFMEEEGLSGVNELAGSLRTN
ncbi:MAG: dihydroorotate dehydrogenase [Synergistaceae bacterium]|jgi:dihydroorotate dehydrogenase (NAD+) catalytic subunit|nr:dihydroorotate dehydrogenase [Synergistaceae bacterium]